MLYKYFLQLLRRFPVLYAGMQGASAYKIMSREPVLTPLGFKMAGTAAMEKGEFEPHETEQVCSLLT